MRICFFGLGSAGLHHYHALRNMGHDLYAMRSGTGRSRTPSDVTLIGSWREAEKIRPAAAIISNPTNLHIQTALFCAHVGMALFMEKPIDCESDTLDDLLTMCHKKDLTTYVAYPFRHHPALRALADAIGRKPQQNVEIVCRTDLSTWRSYRTYSASATTGGGAILELSHEIDLAEFLFGPIVHLEGSVEKGGNVATDAETAATIYAEHENGQITRIFLDLSAPRYARYVKTDAVRIDYAASPELYRTQMAYFLANINTKRMENNLFAASELFRKIIAFRKEVAA